MRESIGGAQVLMISVTILLVMIIVLCASIAYTKAFKARNGIINIVQKYAEYGDSAQNVLDKNDYAAQNEIDKLLSDMGYMVSVGSGRDCPYRGEAEPPAKGRNYNYCIYHFVDDDGNERYGIQTYMYFELPVFGRDDRFSFPIYGDTFTFFKYGI